MFTSDIIFTISQSFLRENTSKYLLKRSKIMYNIICNGITFEVRSARTSITCYHKVESDPAPVNEGFVEVMKNGKTRIISSTTHDEPEITHFEIHTVLENISATVWVFKEYTLNSKKVIVYSNLPKAKIENELSKMMSSMTLEELYKIERD